VKIPGRVTTFVACTTACSDGVASGATFILLYVGFSTVLPFYLPQCQSLPNLREDVDSMSSEL
jgi:hypothetical protein